METRNTVCEWPSSRQYYILNFRLRFRPQDSFATQGGGQRASWMYDCKTFGRVAETACICRFCQRAGNKMKNVRGARSVARRGGGVGGGSWGDDCLIHASTFRKRFLAIKKQKYSNPSSILSSRTCIRFVISTWKWFRVPPRKLGAGADVFFENTIRKFRGATNTPLCV